MKPRDSLRTAAIVALVLGLATGHAHALESDREQPLDVNADSSDGTLGDGVATLQLLSTGVLGAGTVSIFVTDPSGNELAVWSDK